MNYEPGSYRDRNGRVFYAGGAVYRGLSSRALGDWESFAASRFFRQACQEGRIVATERIAADSEIDGVTANEWAAVLKHQRIPFVSYPYEWSFGMLKDAAVLQLELLAAALEEDFQLKDGSAYNIQWLGSRPVFIDIPSFERLLEGEPWAGYQQFCQTMLFPLFLQAYKNTSYHPWLRGCLEGIEPGQCKNLMSWRDLFRSGVLSHVFLHAKLQTNYAGTARNVKADLRSAGFGKGLIQANVRGLLKTVRGLNWKQSSSVWADYATNNTYTDADQQLKEQFVRSVVSARRRGLAWDIGCNTGNYSRIAAENSDYVVAMDSDHLAVERLYQSLKAEKHEAILPLVCNLADASPNLGWRGLERKALAERGRPDLTLCLALIHHIVIGANIPLREFILWLASLGTDLVIEFVSKDDPMVKTLLRNKRDDYSDYSIEFFERCLGESFHVARREMIAGSTRTLYHARMS
jgi:SAM-dependent methyltransferase